MKKKLAILSLSTVTGSATAITTIIPLMTIAFSHQSISEIESLVTVASVSAVTTILLNSSICQILGIKNTIISGLLIGAIFGMLPLLITHYTGVLLCRVFLGVGIGMYSPHAMTLIALFYQGDERSTLLGIQMGIGAMGNALLLLLSGWLATFGWRFAFLVYATLGLIALLILVFVPNIEVDTSIQSSSARRLSKTIISYLMLSLATFIIIWGVQLKIPTYLIEHGIVASSKAGNVLSGMNIAGMLAGFSFGYLFSLFRRFLLPLGYISAALAVIGLVLASEWIWIVLWAVLFNFVYSFTGPAITVKLNTLANENQLTRVNALLTITTIVSSFIAPFVWNTLPQVFGLAQNATNSLLFMIASLIVIGILVLFYTSPKRGRLRN